MVVLWSCQKVVRCVTVSARFTYLLTYLAGAGVAARPAHGLEERGARRVAGWGGKQLARHAEQHVAAVVGRA